MKTLLTQLDAAQKWVTVLAVFLGVDVLSDLLELAGEPILLPIEVIITGGMLLMSIILLIVALNYRAACRMAFASEDEHDIMNACRWQKNLLMMYGIYVLLIVLLVVLIMIVFMAVDVE